MDRAGLHLVGQILDDLDDPRPGGLVLLGEPGTDHTALLDSVSEELTERGRPVFRVSSSRMRYAGELGTAVVDAVAASSYMSAVAGAEQTRRSSSREAPLSESASILHLANLRLRGAVLEIDGLDAAPYPERMLSAIADLSTALDGWKVIVSSRPTVSFSRLQDFKVISLGGALQHIGPQQQPSAPRWGTVTGARFRIRDLKFGAEEAERDELLDLSYVQRPGTEDLLQRRRTIVVGDRGAGKSAIFRRLSAGTGAHPLTNAGDLLHKIVADDAWLDTEQLRAAWLVIVAAEVADVIGDSAPKQLRRDAAALRAVLGFPTEPAARATRALRAVGRVFGGTTVKFTIGPAEIDVRIRSGTAAPAGRSGVDIGNFLREADRILGQSGDHSVVLIDRIDETFKYDRPRQQAIVQALLQAEAHVSVRENIRLIMFLRTDLFELYDIQEKNKLVSRTLRLDWEEEEWLRMLLRRVLANEPLRQIAQVPEPLDDERAALDVLFPPEIEGRPADRWLIDSLRNGNGNVSPRSAVLLLHLARERAASPDAEVSAFPLFSAEEAGEAMTRLSDLSYSEVIDDFKVARSFVQNCRAGKLDTFTLADVRDLFDESEGKISDQIDLLERLGFLERVVLERRGVEGGIVRESVFRIPRLYTRCWDHA